MSQLLFLAAGLATGIFGGMLGIGGAIVMIPILVFLFGFDQRLAQGTTLAMMVPPIGILAAYKYYQMDHVDIKAAAILAVGFFVGGYVGAKFAHMIPAALLKKGFSILLMIVSIKMWIGK